MSTTKQSKEFNAFRELTRKLVAVPKQEIDKKKAKYEQEKPHKKRPAK